MGSIDILQFSRLTEDHLSDCVALSAEAGWNQTSEDWALFLRHGTVLGLRTAQGVTVASAAVLPYPDDFAWISMVLVTASRRRQRIGTKNPRSLLCRGCTARPRGDARCDSSWRTHLPSARFRGDSQFVPLAGRHREWCQFARRRSCDGCRRHSSCYGDRCRGLRLPAQVSDRKPVPSAATARFCERRQHRLCAGATWSDGDADWTPRCDQPRRRRCSPRCRTRLRQWAGLPRSHRSAQYIDAPSPAAWLFGATTVLADGLKSVCHIRGPRALVRRRGA